MQLPYAETVPYFKTGKSSPDVWIDKAVKEIQRVKGVLDGHAFGNDTTTGCAAYMIAFHLGEDRFRITWPVLPSRARNEQNERAARVQAVTLLYHDVKAKCVKAAVFGARTAFFEHLLLPDGREARHAATPELLQALPSLIGRPALTGPTK